jgi:DNA-binding NtrC family response regulator
MQKKILLIDDELKIRELFYDLFSMRGYKIVTAPGAEEGVEIARKEKFDLILSDIKMQTVDGIEALKRIRQFDPKARIIMLTAMEDVELDRQARLNGATGLMRKSWGLLTISKIVNAFLDEKIDYIEEERKKILVADDNPQICSLFEDFLKRKGFKPLIAGSGEEAIERTKKENPIIVLLDINMPGMDGLMTLKKIREINQSVGIIVVTGMSDENVVQEAMKMGIYDYIIKPINFDYLQFSLITKIILMTA